MSRTKTVNGKRVTLGVKVSEGEGLPPLMRLAGAYASRTGLRRLRLPETLLAVLYDHQITVAGPHGGDPPVVINVECRHDG